MTRPRATNSPAERTGATIADLKQRIHELGLSAHRHDTPGTEYVRRSGDTMTGPLVLSDGYIYDRQIRHVSATALNFLKATYPWLRAIRVRCQGGGGGGGGVLSLASRTDAGASGMGGHYAESFLTDIGAIPSSVSVVRGAGGAGGAAGANSGVDGGDSSFGSLVVGVGGTAGTGGDSSTILGSSVRPTGSIGGLGATPGTGQLLIMGGSSGIGFCGGTNFASSGKGGDSQMGGGAPGRYAISTSAVGNPSFGRGGGGSGAVCANAGTNRAGGAGGVGIVILDLYR